MMGQPYTRTLQRIDKIKIAFEEIVRQNQDVARKRDRLFKPLVAKVRKLEHKVETLERLLSTRARLDSNLPDEERLFIEQRMDEEIEKTSSN